MVSFGEYDEVELKDGRTGTIVVIKPDKKGAAIDFGDDWDMVLSKGL